MKADPRPLVVVERVDRLNRITGLAGWLTVRQMEGLIALLEASKHCPEVFDDLTPARAAEAVASMLPDLVF